MTIYTVYNGSDVYNVEADGHFFAQEASAAGILFFMKGGNILSAYKSFDFFEIDQSTMPAPGTVQPSLGQEQSQAA